jgi:putative redox protein
LSQSDTGRTEKVTVITMDGGLRFTADVRGHQVPTDQPERAGGADSAATPLEMLGVSLGACVALYAHQFCATRGLPSDGLTVEVRTESAKAPYRVGRFDVRVILPLGLPEEYRAAMDRAVRSCPVHNTLTHPPEIQVELLAPAGVEE